MRHYFDVAAPRIFDEPVSFPLSHLHTSFNVHTSTTFKQLPEPSVYSADEKVDDH